MKTSSHYHRGFTLFEVVITVAIVVILGVVAAVSLTGKKSSSDLSSTVAQVTALLREAQSRSVTQTQGASWGVHFANATNTAPFYALFSGLYSPTTTTDYYRLPTDVAYIPSMLPAGGTVDIVFSQVSGLASTSTIIGLYNTAQPSLTSGINITLLGTISPVTVN